VSGIVLMRKGENPSEVLRAVKTAVGAINASGLPRPARIVAFYDRTTLIDTTLRTVFRNLLEGAVLVAIGKENAGLFSNDEDLAARILEADVEAGEMAWRLPLSKKYNKR